MMMTILLCAPLFIIFVFLILIYTNPRNKNLPPSPLSLPILGHLHLLKKPLHRSLAYLSQKYGPIIYLEFGSASIIVVSSPSIVSQCCHKTNDIILSNRPISLASKHLSYNFTTMGFAPYGAHWQNLRRVATLHIFSTTSIQKYSVTRAEEVHYIARKLASKCNRGGEYQKADLRTVFLELSYSLMMKMIAGKRWSGSSFDIFAANLLKVNVFEYVPILRWINGRRMEKKLVKLHGERDEFLQGIIDECRRNFKDEGSSTIVQSLLALQK
ncbi:hypothetical protein Leryth_015219 [Lithospermum erythrorhizon]|nr:hypothetical protein Leryth_015219 [Lithospermum erythrorhizon]